MYKPKLTALSKQGKVTLQICLFRLKIEGRGRPSMMAFFASLPCVGLFSEFWSEQKLQ